MKAKPNEVMRAFECIVKRESGCANENCPYHRPSDAIDIANEILGEDFCQDPNLKYCHFNDVLQDSHDLFERVIGQYKQVLQLYVQESMKVDMVGYRLRKNIEAILCEGECERCEHLDKHDYVCTNGITMRDLMDIYLDSEDN